MSNNSFNLSAIYRDEINNICRPLTNLRLKHFAMKLIFNNGSTFVLSNTEERIFNDNLILDEESQKEKENNSPDYKIIRHHSECTFIFMATHELYFHSQHIQESKLFEKLEKFCINFVDHFLDLIIIYNPTYKYSFILTNKNLRDAVIKGGYKQQFCLSVREKECLWLAAQGKTAKQIADILKISPLTVTKHLTRVRNELECQTLVEAIMESIHRGIIGKVSSLKDNP